MGCWQINIQCYGCGAFVDNIEGQPHKYIGTIQGCWNIYEQVLTKEYEDYSYFEDIHRLTVDTYAIQHPGQPCKQSIQSVNLHLIGLYYVLIKNLSGKEATKKIGAILEKKPKFEWLEPPIPNGQITIINVLIATNKEYHEKIVKEWAQDVFGCWLLKHRQAIEKIVKNNF